jgi:hypothetical protein
MVAATNSGERLFPDLNPTELKKLLFLCRWSYSGKADAENGAVAPPPRAGGGIRSGIG